MMTTDSNERTPEGGYKIRTYYPTLEQMKNFSAYMKYIHEDGGHRAGLVKIVPPAEYKPKKSNYDGDVYDMEITCPIKQQVTGEGGLYQQLNIVEKKRMSVRNFKKLAETKHSTPLHANDADLERTFWKNIFTNPSIYGADVPGTLYDDDCDEFNLTRLNTILDNIQDDYGVTIQGVNTTYLYFGMWKSSFCWHTEDIDLYSINYLHTGQPKAWYCIAPEYGKRFERLAASFFPHSFRTCRAFLRHKTTMISPQILKKYSIPFSKCTQKAGEFMVTFPYSYHSGFNHGFNIAEATNFALEYWIDFGKWATRCECSSESVKISMQTFVKRYQADRYENWLRGKDICKDPRDPKHVAAAPKPTEYDLYLIGSHEREAAAAADSEPLEIEETKQKSALQQNQSSNVKLKIKKVKKKTENSYENSYNLYNEYYAHNLQQASPATQYESFCPVPTSMEEKPRDLSIKNLSMETPMNFVDKKKPDNNLVAKRQMKKLKEKEEKRRIKREKKAKERKEVSQELLQFLPSTFTHEKRFNRCIASQPPHCAVCQLLVMHPKDDENIWGRKENSDETRRSSVDTSNDKSTPDMIDTTAPSQPSSTPTLLTASTVSGPRVENFKLPEASPVLLPRGLFIRNPEQTWCDYLPKPSSEKVVKVKREKKDKDSAGDISTISSIDRVEPEHHMDSFNDSQRTEDGDSTTNVSQYIYDERTSSTEGTHQESANGLPRTPNCSQKGSEDDSQRQLEDVEPEKEESEQGEECNVSSEPKENDSGYEEKLEFLDLNLESCELLQCVICMLTVHKLCYGVDKMPDNKKEWTCDRCQESNRSLIGCSLCPCRGGALKQFSDFWVHVTCALCVPDLNFIDLIKPNESTIQKLRLQCTSNEKNTCIYCARNFNLSRFVQGKCIGCIGYMKEENQEVNCPNTFHPTCGHRNGGKFVELDLCHDAQQKNPIVVTCNDCLSLCQFVDLESYEKLPETRSLGSISVGTAVIAQSKDDKLIKGTVTSYSKAYHYDVFFPTGSEVELGIKPSRILNYDENGEYQIGDVVKVRCPKEKFREGKFKARHLVEEYWVKFMNGDTIERIERSEIYLNVDEMTPEQNEKYLRDSGAGGFDIDMEQES